MTPEPTNGFVPLTPKEQKHLNRRYRLGLKRGHSEEQAMEEAYEEVRGLEPKALMRRLSGESR